MEDNDIEYRPVMWVNANEIVVQYYTHDELATVLKERQSNEDYTDYLFFHWTDGAIKLDGGWPPGWIGVNNE